MPAPDPARFEENVRAIEAAAAESPPPRGAVLFVGIRECLNPVFRDISG
jgi:hypothetical protein